jgi:hypothetical protein
MKNKYFIIGASGIVLLVLLALLLVFILGGERRNTPTDNSPVFGDTSAERPFDFDTDEYPGSRGTSSQPVLHGEALPQLRLLSNEPVAAVTTGLRYGEVAIEPYARFVEKETGHMFDIELARTAPQKALTITTIPRIQRAYIASTGSTTVLQYLDGEVELISSFIADVVPTQPTEDEATPYTATLEGTFLPIGIEQLAFSPDGTRVFFLVPASVGTLGYVQDLATGNRTEVWRSPLSELQVSWSSKGAIYISTSPSAEAPGFAWRVDSDTGVADLVLTDVVGITTLANTTGTKMLFSTLEETLASLRVLNLETGGITSVSLVTMPEKCVWSRLDADVAYCAIPSVIPTRSDFPEGWYQGKIIWSDNIWRINVALGTTDFIAQPPDLVDRTIDAVDLVLAPNEDFLVFRSREDDLLWSLKLPAFVSADAETEATDSVF